MKPNELIAMAEKHFKEEPSTGPYFNCVDLLAVYNQAIAHARQVASECACEYSKSDEALSAAGWISEELRQLKKEVT